MKTNGSVLLVLAAGLLGASAARADDGWQVHESSDGLILATRPVSFSAIDEVRAAATFEFPLESILAVLADVEHYPDNLPPTVVARRLRGAGHDAWFYMEIKPGVVSRRFYCIHARVIRLPASVVRVEWSPANDLCPEKQDGMVRMEDNSGAWTLTSLGPTLTRVFYQAHADPGGSIPAGLVNWAAPRTIADLFASVRQAAAHTQLSASRK
jgi:hypothetical protein